jgi:hypothetical protein
MTTASIGALSLSFKSRLDKSGRTWDRTRRSSDQLGSTSGNSPGPLQGEGASYGGASDTLSATAFNSALGQIQDDGEPRLADDPRSQRGPSSRATSATPGGSGDGPAR